MAWLKPPQSEPNSLVSAEFLNTYLRDNLLETMPALAEDEGSYFGTNGPNQIQVSGYAAATASGSVSTSSSSYVALSGGPTITMESNHRSFVVLTADVECSSATTQAFFGYDIDGATSNPPHDDNTLISTGTARKQFSIIIPHTTLVLPGTNTFSARYRVEGGSATFSNRSIAVFTI